MWKCLLFLFVVLFLADSYHIQRYRPRSIMLMTWEKYYGDKTGFGADYRTIQRNNKMGIMDLGVSGTYGEITAQGLKDTIFSSYEFYEQDVMYDLGSGIGKAVIQFAYETKCGKCIGVELGERRHMTAMSVLQDIKLSNTDQYYANKINFILGDVTTTDWSDATVLFINALCFPEDLWHKIEAIMVKSCPSVRLLFLVGKTLATDKGDSVASIGASQYQVTSKICAASWDDENTMSCYERIN
jgi:hypothetical protein